MRIDVLIFGGGVAGLWLLDDLHRAGYRVLLLEKYALGRGQTVGSQGIIHGGLKYTLKGQFTGSAQAIREAPQTWRDCLEGRSLPDLTHTPVRSAFCHLWRTRSLSSWLGSIGAKQGLRIAPKKIAPEDRPDILRQCPGEVMQLDEQVIDPVGLMADFATQHRERLGLYDSISFDSVEPPRVTLDGTLNIEPTTIVLTAGEGNATLRSQLGLDAKAMQRRPLHMAMVRGEHLPILHGHCVDGNATRLTITTANDLQGRVVWQLGGRISEQGVDQPPEQLVKHAREEVEAVLPGFDASGLAWATYPVDRAEACTPGLLRPEEATALHEGNVITGWPTKLAMAPYLSQKIIKLLPAPESTNQPAAWPDNWPRPNVAQAPWEGDLQWFENL